MCSLLFYVFFFKQKTAYEMRISDWSSDVCSSDLLDGVALVRRQAFADGGRIGAAAPVAGDELRHQAEALGEALPQGREVAGLVHQHAVAEIGRASCRERVCQYV